MVCAVVALADELRRESKCKLPAHDYRVWPGDLYAIPNLVLTAWIGNLEDDRIYYPGSAYDILDLSSFVVLMYRCRLDAKGRSTPYSCINTTDLSNYKRITSDEQGSSHDGALPRDWVGIPRCISLPKTDDGFDAIDSGHLQFWSGVAKAYIGHYISKNAREMCFYDVLNSRGETVVFRASIPLYDDARLERRGTLRRIPWTDI